MNTTYEIMHFKSNMPLRCMIHHIGFVASHSHEMFEIIFILSGSCTLTMENHNYRLNENDIIIIESLVNHELFADNCVYITVQLDRTNLEKSFPVPIHPHFEAFSQTPGKEKAFEDLRFLIANIIKNNVDKPFGYEIKNWIYTYELMEILYLNFRIERSAAFEKKNHRYAARVNEIATIIKEHYTEDITLSMISDMLHLSVPYLSKFFIEHFGVNYLTYLTKLRLDNATYDLINTEKTIEMVSSDNGFPNSNAFTNAFKKEYHMLPSAYRRKHKALQTVETSEPILHHDYMTTLKKYLVKATSTDDTELTDYKHITFSVLDRQKELTHTWKNTLTINQAADILIADIQNELRRIKQEIGYEYLFFNGIFSDNMYVYRMDSNKQAHFNFSYVDKVLDFIQSISLRPHIQLSYMPADIAKSADRYRFNHLLSEPKDLSLWTELVEKFMEHIISRYGLKEILKWKFSVWHLPNTLHRIFGFSSQEDFFNLYKASYDTVKSFSPQIIFGLPCMYYLAENSKSTFHVDMINWCQAHDCPPDFLNFTFYDTIMDISQKTSQTTFGFVAPMTLNTETNGLKKAISRINKTKKQLGIEKLPTYISEWNNTPSQEDYLNDTCFKSCYIVKNTLENYDKTDSLSYYCFSDLIIEHSLPTHMFFGGLGLFTTNGIPKASYYALYMLNHLGDTLINKGDGWFATKVDDEIRIITYNYKHFTDLYAKGERFDMTLTDRYPMFESGEIKNLQFELKDIEDGEYSINEYILNRENGSSFDTWVAGGCIDPSTPFEKEILENRSTPMLHKSKVTVKNHTLILDVKLEVLEVRLIIIK